MGNLFDDLGKNLGDLANNIAKETGRALDNTGKAVSETRQQASKVVSDVVSEAGKVASGAVNQVTKVAEDVFHQTVEIGEEVKPLEAPEEEILDLNTFELSLDPQKAATIDVTKKELYNYDFAFYALSPLQEVANQMSVAKAATNMTNLVEETDALFSKKEIEYVAKLTEEAKQKLKANEWKWCLKKENQKNLGVLRDSTTGQIKEMVNLEPRSLEKSGISPELLAMQMALGGIMEQIECLNQLMERVEQGQYNDRYAGFFSARQLVVEALAMTDEESRKELLLSAVKVSNETIAKLMLSIHQDAHAFIRPPAKQNMLNYTYEL